MKTINDDSLIFRQIKTVLFVNLNRKDEGNHVHLLSWMYRLRGVGSAVRSVYGARVAPLSLNQMV
jgi:hypothetical protein